MPAKTNFVLISIVAFGAFIVFSFIVRQGFLNGFDFDTTVRLQNHFPRAFDVPFSVFSLLGSLEVTGLIWAGFVIYFFLRKQTRTIFALCLLFFGLFIEIAGKFFLYHPSPPFRFYRGLGIVFPSNYLHTDYSYPSGHVFRTSFMVFFMIAFLYNRKFVNRGLYAFLLILFLLVMAVSRIYLGEHWFSDVVGGVFLGTWTGLAAGITINRRGKGTNSV